MLPEKPSRVKWLLTLCLRLAVVFMRRRQPVTSLPVSLETDDQKLILRVGRKWLEDHPLTRYTLSLEAAEWKKAGFTLDIIPS
ncbi:exopolyphosphatase [Advenella kashmirensis WT001]|uniref:Exopolyphosphatase n=1 Tax=Advenella kashmirensis (strain DSM 17095 / LMG 22695 / WT001) TaxID=1036672 RepID=I3UAN4_ADVKW|nr:exopolyphosphatase [Advenella kashmirensis WT001]